MGLVTDKSVEGKKEKIVVPFKENVVNIKTRTTYDKAGRMRTP